MTLHYECSKECSKNQAVDHLRTGLAHVKTRIGQAESLDCV